MSMTRVGLFLVSDESWMGGLNYQRTLIFALLNCQEFKFEPFLFFNCSSKTLVENYFSDIPGLNLIENEEEINTKSFSFILSGIVFGKNRKMKMLCNKYKIDVFFENASFFGWSLPAKVVSWIPDLQHRYLKDNFSRLSYWRRDFGFRLLRIFKSNKRRLLFSSQSSLKQFLLHFGGTSSNSTVARFVPNLELDKIEARTLNVVKKYHIDLSYFYIPNQFWPHKNHSILADAIVRLVEGFDGVLPMRFVISGGYKGEVGESLYSSFQKQVKNLGLQSEVMMLGFIPYSDVISLTNGSIALINPSLFEGWSTTVEEAKLLKKPLVLSDIEIHREQAPNALFFDASDAASLASTLSRCWNKYSKGNLGVVSDKKYESSKKEFFQNIQSAFIF